MASYKKYEDILKIELVSHSTSPAPEKYGKDLKELITFCARVSNPSNQSNMDTADKLIKYLLKHKHFSPFEMVNVCLEITSTRDIIRQILRHRSFTFQEFSQRYADPVQELDFCIRECRFQDTKNRQNSISINAALQNDQDYFERNRISSIFYNLQHEHIQKCKEDYSFLVSHGVAKEQARAILPEGNTISRCYMSGTLRSWLHYIEVREKNGTQKEHMMIARECAKVISKLFPPIIDLQENI